MKIAQVQDSPAVRRLFIGSLLTAMFAVVLFTAWALWPEWQKYYEVQSLLKSVEGAEGTDYVSEGGIGGCNLEFHDIDEHVEQVRKRGACDRTVDSLLTLARNESPRVRWRSVHALSRIALEVEGAKPQIIAVIKRALDDEDNQVTTQAYVALETIDKESADNWFENRRNLSIAF